jgi:hypothetical protein
MTVGAQQLTLLDLFANLVPASSISTMGNPKVFFGRVPMVELQGVGAPIITASDTPAAHVIDRHLSYPLSPLLHSLDQVLAPISVGSLLSHRDMLLDTAACSTIELPRNPAARIPGWRALVNRISLFPSIRCPFGSRRADFLIISSLPSCVQGEAGPRFWSVAASRS